MVWKVILLTLGVVALAIALLCVKVLLKRNGRFSSIHIGDSKAMRERGIGCATSQDRKAQSGEARRLNVKDL